MSNREKAENSSYVQYGKKSFQEYASTHSDTSNWEYKFHKKYYEDAVQNEIDILEGKKMVVYKNLATGKFTDADKYGDEQYDRFEPWQLKCSTMWDSNNISLAGNRSVRSSIEYKYIKGENTEDGNPIFLGWENHYDGGVKQKQGVKNGDGIISWEELKVMFPTREFE